MAGVAELMAVGKELGLVGDQLAVYIKQQQDLEREKRAFEREAQKLEVEKLKIEAQKLELEKEKLTMSSSVTTGKTKIPLFNEDRDKFDSYISRFESYAEIRKWKKEEWPIQLSLVLTGKALDTFYGLPDGDQKDYDKVKNALLRRYLLTEDELRKQFYTTKVEVGETPTQYITRTSRLFDKWVEATKIGKGYDELRSLLIREQFLRKCHADLAAFLREKKISEINELAEVTQRYLDAHGGTMYDKSKVEKKGQKPSTKGPKSKSESVSQNGQLCGHCKKGNHQEEDCWFKKQNAKDNASQKNSRKRCFICDSPDHVVKNCPKKGEVGSFAVELKETKSCDSSSKCTCVNVHNACICVSEVLRNAKPDSKLLFERDGQSQMIHASECEQTVSVCKCCNFPVSKGSVNDIAVSLMRDSGCSTVVVNKKLVKPEQFTGEYKDCMLIDGTIRRLPVAVVKINCSYVSGMVEALVVKTPVFDLIIGNTPRVIVETNKVCQRENKVQTETEIRVDELNETNEVDLECEDSAIGAAVVTRHQAKTNKKPLVPLKVTGGETVEKTVIVENQKNDSSLAKYWNLVGTKKARETKSGIVTFENKKGVLNRVFTPHNGGNPVKQLVVPEQQRLKVLTVAHEGLLSGHCGIRRTTERVLSNFYWPGVNSDISRHVRSCEVCQKMSPKGNCKAPLVSMPVIQEPFKRVSVDLIGPIVPCTERGHRYILTVIDYATRYPEAVALKAIDTVTVAEALVEIYTRLGFPEQVQSDRGTQFLSDCMKEVERLLSIKHIATSPYHPQCNGLVEHFNGTLKTILKKVCSECPKQWDRYLPAVLFAYRSTEHESTGFSPFELMLGRKVRGPMDLLKQYWTKDESECEDKPVYKYVVELKQRLQETCDLAHKALGKAQAKQKVYYDKKTKPKSLKVGARVLLLLPMKKNKLLLQWRGPYVVVAKTSPVNYQIQVGRKTKNFHVNMLKSYVERVANKAETVVSASCQYVHTDNDSETDYESFESTVGDFGRDEVIASVMVNDFDANDEENRELIHVCPIASNETIADVKVNPNLTLEQKREVQMLLEEFSDIFTELPGCTDWEQHEIKLTTDEPVRAKSYPLPYSMREVIDKEIDEMLKLGIIRPSKSPYTAPPVIVKKADGNNRFCVNFSKLNCYTVFDSEPMPEPESLYMKMKGKEFRSKIDCSKGYWQILMHPDSIEKTCFTVMGNRHQGAFEFLRMPFGLQNSAASFNRLMRKVCGDLDDVDSFMDDVEASTYTWEQHMLVLRKLFTRMREAGLTAKPSKCMIGFTEVDYVGHEVELNTLRPREAKCAEILAVERPKTKKQVQSFLAMIGYYSKFIPKFADTAAPLTELVKKNKPNVVSWGETQQRAFESLKLKLSTAPVLVIPDCNKTMFVQTDASDVGLGAVLLQEHEGVLHPVKFLSRKLKEAEKHYSTIEKEGLAIVWAIEKLAIYLYGVEFVLLTDHKPLTFMKQTKMRNARVMRWSLFLQDWSFTIKSIKGVDNLMADYLSRA